VPVTVGGAEEVGGVGGVGAAFDTVTVVLALPVTSRQ
jgi:hypothetical protein